MRDEMELVVCTTCRLPASCPAAPRDGARLSAALDRCGIPHRPHRCLSACSRGCVVVLRGAGRWTFVLGGLDPDRDADALREMIGAYRAAPAGLVPWRERPGVVRSNTIARIPPPESRHAP